MLPASQHSATRNSDCRYQLELCARQWPTLRLIHLPIHASWLDQCEIYFSIVQRKVVHPNDFTDTDQITCRLAAFEDRYNELSEPFEWTFGRDDLDKLLARIAAHEQAA